MSPMRNIKSVLALFAFTAIVLVAATAAPLAVGSKAPALAADKWIKGEPVSKFEPGTVYVIEFWATWCGPCIKAIPHLNDLQKKYGDKVVVIGVAGAEKKPKSGADTRFDKVKKFVDGKGAAMDYRVVYDPTEASWTTWMKAAGKGGIPCTFIVDHTGKIGYIGHPTQMDASLAAMVKKAPAKKSKSNKDDGDKSDEGGSGKKDGGRVG